MKSDNDAHTNGRGLGKPALLSTLAKVRLGSVVSLMAPAGYGKTALLQAWQEHADLRAIGVRLGVEHNHVDALGLHLLDALGGVVPGGRDLAGGRPGASDWSRTLLRVLSQTYLILMLDDLHHLTNPDALALVKHLVQHTPRRMVLAVSSRRHPVVGLARARAEGRLLSLSADDLALTRADLAVLRRQHLTDEQIDDVYVTSGGWPAALPWAIAHATADPQAGRERVAVCRFLDEEVWPAFDQRFVDRLADAALLAPVTFDTLDAAREAGDAQQLGKRLSDHPVPLVSIADERLITVHPLVAGSVQSRRTPTEPADRARLLRLGAEHLLRTDRADDAFRLWLLARDRSRLIDFVYVAGRQAALQGRTAMVRRWLDEFTSTELTSEVRLQAVSVALDAAEGNLDAAARWVRRLSALKLTEDEHASEMSGVLSEILAVDGGSKESLKAVGWWGIVAELMDALAVMNEGQLEVALLRLEGQAPLCADLPLIDAWRLHTVGYLLLRLERDEDARAAVRAGSALLEQRDMRGHPTGLVLDALEALLAARDGDRRGAVAHLDVAQKKLPYLAQTVPARALLPTVVMAEAAFLLGLEQRAAKILDTLNGAALEARHDGFLRDEYDRLSGLVHAARGDHELAVTAVQQRILRSLASHKTVPAIAREMDRSPATIRTHIRTLYATLDVHSRAEAVERARTLRLLQDESSPETPD